jgi:hypothetical protein
MAVPSCGWRVFSKGTISCVPPASDSDLCTASTMLVIARCDRGPVWQGCRIRLISHSVGLPVPRVALPVTAAHDAHPSRICCLSRPTPRRESLRVFPSSATATVTVRSSQCGRLVDLPWPPRLQRVRAVLNEPHSESRVLLHWPCSVSHRATHSSAPVWTRSLTEYHQVPTISLRLLLASTGQLEVAPRFCAPPTRKLLSFSAKLEGPFKLRSVAH